MAFEIVEQILLYVVGLSYQNLILPECFFSFVDLRKEFHKCCTSAGPAHKLEVSSMLECIFCCRLS